MTNISTGRQGEYYAQQYLIRNNFVIRHTNYRTKMGEIDIVASKDSAIHFIEVKTRIGDVHGKPYEAVNYYKLQHMRRSAEIYVLQNKLNSHKLSLDVVSIILFPDETVQDILFFENITL